LALVTPGGKVTITGFRAGIWGATTPAVEKITTPAHKAFFTAFDPLILFKLIFISVGQLRPISVPSLMLLRTSSFSAN
jgi:hypothetical protein